MISDNFNVRQFSSVLGNDTRWLHSQHAENFSGTISRGAGKEASGFVTAWSTRGKLLLHKCLIIFREYLGSRSKKGGY